MKTLLVIFSLTFAAYFNQTSERENINSENTIEVVSEVNSDYCDGWSEGWADGWRYECDWCVVPTTPICPVPKVGRDKYKHGYNRAFVKARREYQKRNQ